MRVRVLAKDVVELAAAQAGVRAVDLLGPNTARRYARPRHRAWRAIKALRPEISYPMLGRMFGGRHHTSVLGGARTAIARAAMDPAEAQAFDALVASALQAAVAASDRAIATSHAFTAVLTHQHQGETPDA